MGKNFIVGKKDGHGIVNLRKGIQRSCDVYFYEVARKLGVDRLSETAKRFGLGKKVLNGFIEEKAGVVPNTKWKKKIYRSKLVFGRDFTFWNRSRLFSKHTITTLFNDRTNC